MSHKSSYLRRIGVYGYDEVEPVILAALVTEDPLLLVGQAGTGKTFLLNSLSEAMGLEHRHYNASLISFDDLVGFPYPNSQGTSIRYIETPATVWQAESVLVDEINRCKPEHQNRFFSLVHERRLQGLKLENLRYRWAAMNPVSADQGGGNGYGGCELLDYALADRFAFVVTVADWKELSDEDQRSVADPRGDGWISSDDGALKQFIATARVKFQQLLADPCPQVIDYCRAAATALGEVHVRISPRRVRQWVRNMLAIHAVSNLYREQQFRLALQWGLPQRATGLAPEDAVLHAAHRTAWDSTCLEGPEKWLHEFHCEKSLAVKAAKLLDECPDPDTGTLAITQLMANESKERAAAFALALYPLALSDQRVNVGAEGVQELGLVANAALDVEGSRTWWDSRVPRPDPMNTYSRAAVVHPAYAKCAEVFNALNDGRQARAKQLFSFLFVNKIEVKDPSALEQEFHGCIQAARAFQKNGGVHGAAA